MCGWCMKLSRSMFFFSERVDAKGSICQYREIWVRFVYFKCHGDRRQLLWYVSSACFPLGITVMVSSMTHDDEGVLFIGV